MVHQLEVGSLASALLYIARVGRHLKLVDLVVVPPIIGIHIMLIVGLSHIHHADVLSVDELMHRLIALAVDVDAR